MEILTNNIFQTTMKKIVYVAFLGMLMAATACGNKNNEQNESSNLSDSAVTAVNESVDTSMQAETTEPETTAPATETPAPATESAAPEETQPQEPAKEEPKVSKNSKKIDQLLKQCDADIHDIKMDGYDNGKPMDPADLQFSEVRTFLRSLRLSMQSLKSLESEMTDEQKAKFSEVEKNANKIFKDIDL